MKNGFTGVPEERHVKNLAEPKFLNDTESLTMNTIAACADKVFTVVPDSVQCALNEIMCIQ